VYKIYIRKYIIDITEMNTLDDNTKEIAHEIFSKPPQPPNFIQLQLEEQTAQIACKADAHNFINEILNEILFVITSHGIKYLYGHKNLLALSDKQIEKIKEYVRSYGYNVEFHQNHIIFKSIL